jgi:hypothetical protein
MKSLSHLNFVRVAIIVIILSLIAGAVSLPVDAKHQHHTHNELMSHHHHDNDLFILIDTIHDYKDDQTMSNHSHLSGIEQNPTFIVTSISKTYLTFEDFKFSINLFDLPLNHNIEPPERPPRQLV